MVELQPPLRLATPEDAGALAELIDFAGEGLPSYLWARMAEPGETVWDVGRRRARREEGSFSYRNAVVVEQVGSEAGAQGEVVSCLIGYPLPEQPEPIGPEFPRMFVPLQELENLVPGSWYVNVLASYPGHRGQGHGTRLLGLAERLAAARGCKGLSIIVYDTNEGARRLYERCGYRPLAERRVVKEDWENPVEDAILLVKRL